MPITPALSTAFPGDPAQNSATAFGDIFVASHQGRQRPRTPGCNSLLFVFTRNVITDVEYLADENSVHFLHNNAVQGHSMIVTRVDLAISFVFPATVSE